ncbi:hypothetical protein KSD_96690 [Ktedonobacter sp. SOSP1-85]|nr:hypothetical protein KSD_96690 [Ktedonobacter sp. SOSP1-85]
MKTPSKDKVVNTVLKTERRETRKGDLGSVQKRQISRWNTMIKASMSSDSVSDASIPGDSLWYNGEG